MVSLQKDPGGDLMYLVKILQEGSLAVRSGSDGKPEAVWNFRARSGHHQQLVVQYGWLTRRPTLLLLHRFDGKAGGAIGYRGPRVYAP